MSTFEYVSILISIIIGLGMTHILRTWGQMLSGHRGYRSHWIHVLWTGNALFYMVCFWWFTFKWVEKPEWSFALFLFTLGWAIILYLLAVVLIPFGTPNGFDFYKHFLDKRHIFFGGCLVVLVIDVLDAIIKGPENLAALGPVYPWYMVTLLGGTIGAIIFRRETYHGVFAIYFPVAQISFIFYTAGATSILRGTS